MTNEEQYIKVSNILTKLSETVTVSAIKGELQYLINKYSLLSENSKVFNSIESHASMLLDGPVTPPKGMTPNGTSIVSNSAADLL